MNALVHIYDRRTGRLAALALLEDDPHLRACASVLAWNGHGSALWSTTTLDAEIELHRHLAMHGPLPIPNPRMN